MAALTLTRLVGDTYVIGSPAAIGVHVTDGRATVIDSGNDDDAGRQIHKLLTERGWELELIINTHSNADHIGGNAPLHRRTGCRVAATAAEAAFITHPLLEPSLLNGGHPVLAYLADGGRLAMRFAARRMHWVHAS